MLNTRKTTGQMPQDNPEIDIVLQAGDWPDEAEILDIVSNAIAATVDTAKLRFPNEAELSVVLSNDEQVQILNKSWRKIDRPTNVLSFPVEDVAIGEMPGLLLGDIVLSIETITKEAAEQGISFNNHLSHLVIHGFLHIFGYDHIEDQEAEQMEALETACLGRLGIANPYATAYS